MADIQNKRPGCQKFAGLKVPFLGLEHPTEPTYTKKLQVPTESYDLIIFLNLR